MLNSYAQEMVQILRTDLDVRRGFDMDMWFIKTDCTTVGCIAGWTREIFAVGDDRRKRPDAFAAALFELKWPLDAHLFVPSTWQGDLKRDYFEFSHRRLWADHPNWRCDLDTISKMRKWANRQGDLYPLIGPDEAANALEALEARPGYVDWRGAVEG